MIKVGQIKLTNACGHQLDPPALNSHRTALHESSYIRCTQTGKVDWTGTEAFSQKLAYKRQVIVLRCRCECTFLLQVETKFNSQSVRRRFRRCRRLWNYPLSYQKIQ